MNATTGAVLASVKTRHPPSEKHVFESIDEGLSFQKKGAKFLLDARGNVPDLHFNEAGITSTIVRIVMIERADGSYGPLGGTQGRIMARAGVKAIFVTITQELRFLMTMAAVGGALSSQALASVKQV